MIRSTALFYQLARLAVILPFLSACGDAEDADAETGGSGTSPAGERSPAPTNVPAAQRPGAATTADDDPTAAGGDSDDDPSTRVDSAGDDVTSAIQGRGPAPVQLRSAGTFAILAQSTISNVPTSAITGDLGISPAAASSITGFVLTLAGTKLTAPEVVGDVFAADGADPTPSDLTAAIGDMQTAYDDAAGRTTPEFLNLGDGSIGGLTLTPGLYKWTSVVGIPSDVTISGSANDVWIFQISGDLSLSSGKRMTLRGGAKAKNIVWQVAGAVDLGATSHAEGIMLSKTAIHLATGSSINGRLLAQSAVTLDQVTVTEPAL